MLKTSKTNFSVLMPVYAKEKPKNLNEALESIYSQTVFPSEVVICEDGKLTQELDSIIKEYKQRYPKNTKVVKFPTNRGLGNALHDGILECSNEVIFRMDSDDISVGDRFEKQLAVLQETKADVVGSNIVEYDEKMNVMTGSREVPELDTNIKQYAKKRNPINHMTVCYKRSAVLSAGNYLVMDGFEDYYLWVRMIKNGANFYNIQKPLVKVRGGASMISRRGGLSYVRKTIAFEKELRKIGFISAFQYCTNTFPRILVSIAPSFIRRMFYSVSLRGSQK